MNSFDPIYGVSVRYLERVGMLKVETIDARIAEITIDNYRSCWLLRDRKNVLIESGYPADHHLLLKGLARLGTAPQDIDYLALTHIHMDHAGGAGHLVRINPDLTVIVHEKGARHLANPDKLLQAVNKVHGSRAAVMGKMMPIPGKNIVTVFSGSAIKLGDTLLSIYDTPGHAKHHVVFHHPDSASVFTGDALGSKLRQRPNYILTPPSDYDKDLAKKSIHLVQSLKPKRINFTHGGSYQIEDEKYFYDHLCKNHDDWTKSVNSILYANPDIDDDMLWQIFLAEWPELKKYRDQQFSFRLSVSGIRAYLEHNR